MRAFGFLSFGHYSPAPGSRTRTAGEMLRQTVEIAEGADEIGVNGAYVRVHHFARQAASPIPVLTAMAAWTKRIEVGTGVIDMRYENPLYLAEEAAALDLLSDGRVALGVSRGSPETALRGYEAFGYTGSSDPRGADIARDHFARFWAAINGEKVVDADPRMAPPGRLSIEPRSATLPEHIWWGSGSRDSAVWAGRMGLNMMTSTPPTSATAAAGRTRSASSTTCARRSARPTPTPRTGSSSSSWPTTRSCPPTRSC